jgi:hypothetical protein
MSTKKRRGVGVMYCSRTPIASHLSVGLRDDGHNARGRACDRCRGNVVTGLEGDRHDAQE